MNEATFEGFCSKFDREDTCVQSLYNVKWPEGYRCPRCNHQQAFTIRTRRLPLYECRSCRHQASLIAGTIMEGSRVPLRSWFQAFYLHARSTAISAIQLSQIIGVTYKTAWLMGHKIRHAMSLAEERQLLTGLIRITPTIYGRTHNPSVYRHPQEHPLLIGATLDGQGEPQSIKIKQVAGDDIVGRSASHGAIRKFQQSHVKPNAIEVISDLGRHIRERSLLLNQIGKAAANWLNSTFKGIGPKHLQGYLDQFCYQWNHAVQGVSSVAQTIYCSAASPRITYKDLIARPPRTPFARDYYRVLKSKPNIAG
jgi:transposase-like protein